MENQGQRVPVTFEKCIKCGEVINTKRDKLIEFDEEYIGRYICNTCFDKSNVYVECEVENCNNIFNLNETDYTIREYENPYYVIPCPNCQVDI